MLRIWIVGALSTIKIDLATFFLLVIVLLYLVILSTGAQSVTADKNARRSNASDKYKRVRQQDIIKY